MSATLKKTTNRNIRKRKKKDEAEEQAEQQQQEENKINSKMEKIELTIKLIKDIIKIIW